MKSKLINLNANYFFVLSQPITFIKNHMKSLKTILVVITILFGFKSFSQEQKGFNISGGPALGFVINESKSYKTGYGLQVQGAYSFNQYAAIVVNGGYITFKSKFYTSKFLSFIPLQIGFRTGYQGVYIQGQAGVAINSGDQPSGSNPILTGRAGYIFNIKKSGIDLYVTYSSVKQIIYTYGTVGASYIHYFGK